MIFARCGLDGPNSDSQFCSNFLVCVSLRQKPNNFYLAWGWLSLLMLSGMRLIFGLEKTLHHDVGYSGAQEQLTSGNVARGRVLDSAKTQDAGICYRFGQVASSFAARSSYSNGQPAARSVFSCLQSSRTMPLFILQ